MPKTSIEKYLPLTESTYYIMLSLIEPAHGYQIMQTVETISQGTVRLGPGTLYGVFSNLEGEGLIEKVKEEERRKYYALSPKGKQVLAGQVRRLEIMTKNGMELLDRLEGDTDSSQA